MNQSDFETLRTALLNNYNQQALTHAGYLITTIVAIATLFWTFFYKDQDIKNFHKKDLSQKIVLYMAFGFLVFLLLYFVYRLIFWAWMSSEVLTVTQADALKIVSKTVISGIQTSLLNSFKTTAPFGPSSIPSLLYYLDQNSWVPWSLVLLYPVSIFASVISVKLLTKKGFPIPKKTSLKTRAILVIIILVPGMASYYLFVLNNTMFSIVQKVWIIAIEAVDLVSIAFLSNEVIKVRKFRYPKLFSFEGKKRK